MKIPTRKPQVTKRVIAGLSKVLPLFTPEMMLDDDVREVFKFLSNSAIYYSSAEYIAKREKLSAKVMESRERHGKRFLTEPKKRGRKSLNNP